MDPLASLYRTPPVAKWFRQTWKSTCFSFTDSLGDIKLLTHLMQGVHWVCFSFLKVFRYVPMFQGFSGLCDRKVSLVSLDFRNLNSFLT